MLGLLLILSGWLLRADAIAPFGRLSWLTYDAALQWLQPPEQVDHRIVIVDIDDDALSAHGRWPWPRGQLAELVAVIQAAEPSMLGLDILLPEPSDPDQDLALARQLAAPNVLAATAFSEVQPPPARSEPARAARELSPSITLAYHNRAPEVGHITPELESDGRIRRLYSRIQAPGEPPRTTLALAILEAWTDLPARELPRSRGDQVCVASFCLWSTPSRGLLIPYHHPSRFDYLSAAEVMAGKHRERLSGSLVLVGTSAAGLGDLVATPRGALTPGVELHAVLLAASLDSLAWRPLPNPRGWWLAGLGVLGLIVFPNLTGRRSAPWQRALAVAVGAALWLAPVVLATQGWWLDPWAWWGGVSAAAIFWLGWKRWQLWQRHRRLYRAFGAYVPRTILRQMVEEGGEARFAPQRRPLVIMFSDIVGFTEISEALPPEQLALLTNRIFTELTEVVHAHGGTLDKYIGDALMAFWGAPLCSGDDARQALACAGAMQKQLVSINHWARSQGYPEIGLHIGLESGEVTVGNLGSQQRLAYTALGPAVNLAARLEEHAGLLGEPVLVGPTLAATLQGQVELQALGEVSLKGVSQPVALWRPADNA